MTSPSRRTDLHPEIRLTAQLFERVYATEPHGAWWAPGVLRLLGPLTVPLPWGALIIAAPLHEGSELYSGNYFEPALPADDLPHWALPCVRALGASRQGVRAVVRRALPAEMGLSDGEEAHAAMTLALRDLYGRLPAPPEPQPFPFDLEHADLRLLVIHVGADALPSPWDADGDEPWAGGPEILGKLLLQAHRRGNPAVDAVLDAACGAGALGGRGIGRCVVLLAPVDCIAGIRAAVRPRRVLSALPSGPARRAA